ncbi:beta-1,3-galactosyltransferase brn [Homalodisca vitripennis]|uniref:beta-1,3-galactosyltransferase brn n=1 Tax=Homalodisca vitripennis TaxID=197043 RepID=UPI001EEABB0D|nr:beta-1,3-galactosyltransferase brn [Homalodisca vitripennis]KAG8265510.1 Beta-1,3-galactosyltransferase 1 [Homalodisca vitripennis]
MMFKNRIRFTSKKRKIFLVLIVAFVVIYMGVLTHLFEKDFYNEFSYPLEGDISVYVNELREGRKPSHEPINQYNYPFIHNCKYKCGNDDGPLRVVYIVKSAASHYQNRLAIRNSWGFEKRFSDVPIRTVFVLGVDIYDSALQESIDLESKQFGDIIQANFTDTYFNNTIKTMIGFKWAVTFCNNSKFYFFVDDDFYVSTRNVLQFLRNPVHYPSYLEMPIDSIDSQTNLNVPTKRDLLHKVHPNNSEDLNGRKILQVLDFELPEKVKLFAGYVFVSSPHRHRSSKWYVPLSEYPFHLWPPYATAGSYVVSKEVLLDLYYGSLYTKHFRFDDIYLALVAYKLNIEPFHCDEFYFYKKGYSSHNYHYVIASHGYGDPNELLNVWNEQKSVGNA